MKSTSESMRHGGNGKLAAKATLHCLVGCNIGEAIGAGIGVYLGLAIFSTIFLGVAFAFLVGYLFMIIPLLTHGMGLGQAVKITVAGDTASISAMESAENLVAFLIPGFLSSALTDSIFWLGASAILAVGFLAAYPVNYILIKRGSGEHAHHHH